MKITFLLSYYQFVSKYYLIFYKQLCYQWLTTKTFLKNVKYNKVIVLELINILIMTQH